MMKLILDKIARDTENKVGFKLILLFIPVAYVSFLFHEFGHWIVGEILGNNMVYSLNYVWPKSGQYINITNDLYVSIGGPAFTIILSIIFLLIIEKYKTIYAYPFVIFQFSSRFFSLVFGGFSNQDESKISASLGINCYIVALIVLILLLLIAWRGSYKLRLNFKSNWYLFTICILCQLLVIETYKLI